MRTIHTNLRHIALACLLPTIAIGGTAHAESVAQAQANYQQDKNDCLNGQTSESKKTCLREAGAALNDAKNGKLEKFNTNFEANAMARCQVFKKEDDRQLCERRQREGTVSGSVAGGGDIREYTETITVPADQAAPAPTAPTSAPQAQPQDSVPQQPPMPQQQDDMLRNQVN